MFKKILKGLAGLLVTAVVLVIVVYIATGPQRLGSDSASASWLEDGPHSVGTAEFVFIDESRLTEENRGFPGKPNRSFQTWIWYPEDLPEPLPLIVHSHGIMSQGSELVNVAERLASNGYIVVAANYPLTNGGTEGGANANDVVNQPADVSFLIDSVLNLSGEEKPFAGSIDPNRIGLSGYSLGGLTTVLATYHPRWRDPRISAAISIAGPINAFTPQFYSTRNIPFLGIYGTADALIDYETNGLLVPERIRNSSLVTIAGGSHLGFMAIADPVFRFMHNPDSIGCQGVLSVLDEGTDDVFMAFGTEAEVVLLDPSAPAVCEKMPPLEASHPGRQAMILEIAELAFFESVFGETEDIRSAAKEQLETSLAADFEEASYLN
ncbi:MAG: hypothetical protein GKR91_10885 [Pseudomonadales bacterium]|nr:hypothetical protein [Pseudomonadales bacterium]